MNILILMAGTGQRFIDDGITTPKPLIEVSGKSILEWTTRSLPFIKHYNEPGEHARSDSLYFAVRADHVKEYQIDKVLKSIYGDDINIIEFNQITRGNLETAYISSLCMDDSEPLLVLDCDNKYDDNNYLDTLVESLVLQKECMVVAYFDPIDTTTKWAYIYTDGALVTELVEKDPLANERGGLPLIGTFWFSHTSLFLRYADYIIANDLRTGIEGREEFFISQVPALYVANKHPVFTHKVTNVIPLGTPEDVTKFSIANLS